MISANAKKGSRKDDPRNNFFIGNAPGDTRFAESYRTLRANLQFSFIEKDFRSVMVTSSTAEEGKSTTASNLACTMAQAGKSVLLIDADLRKPSLGRLLRLRGTMGLTGLISDVFGTTVDCGDLGPFSVSDLCRLLYFQKRTGRLSLADEKEKINIFFCDGELEDVHWVTRPNSKKLASLLVRSDVITSKQAEDALSRKKNTGQKIGFILLNLGLLKEDELAGYVTLHMLEGLRAALMMRSGKYSFEKLPRTHFERRSFNPADLNSLYQQVVLGHEELPFLQSQVDAAIVSTNVDNLSLLPAGAIPPEPTELLESDRLKFLLQWLHRRYDTVVIDTPPVLLTSDPLLLAPHADGVLLVVRAGMLNREAVQKAVEMIRHAQPKLLGVALNRVDMKRGGYYKYYSKYYGQYYGKR